MNTKKNSLFLACHNLSPDVLAFSTTRSGGCSVGEYASFNINPFCGDNPLHVDENLLMLSEEIRVPKGHIVMPHQIHGVSIKRITEDFFLQSETDRKMLLEGIDALTTDIPQVCIGVSTADCIPVFLYDKEHHAVAVSHAGWRGTVARIVAKTLETMAEEYGTAPQDVVAVIGPGICLEHFEVGDEVYQAFYDAGFDMQKVAKRHERWHIDLPLCNALELQLCGVKSENIRLSGLCTYCDNDRYFSARRQGILSGRIYNGIMLKK